MITVTSPLSRGEGPGEMGIRASRDTHRWIVGVLDRWYFGGKTNVVSTS
jgi:hypothetical protein